MTQRAKCHKGDAQFLCSLDQASRLVQRLKSRVLGLNGIDFGD